tara:strand:+ start:584 stop:2077 length:1494 start_codon:yes stop_codon:yes gene_type:complete
MHIDYDKIVEEWAWRVPNGKPDFKNQYHRDILREVLIELNYPPELLTEKKVNSKDIALVKSLGGERLPDNIIEDIVNGKYKDTHLNAGSGNTYSVSKKKYNYNDLKKELSKNDKLLITTAGTVKKVRTQYGERICQLSVSKAKDPNRISKSYMEQITTLFKLSKLKGIEVKNKVAPGIGYEKMQVDNLDEHMEDILGISNHRPLQLSIAGKNMGVSIDGGAKVPGSPKADLAFGIKGKPNFFVSYKHGEYKSESGKELKASFQQYGSVKTFFTKEFQSAIEDAGVEKAIKSFLDTATKKATYTYAGITGIKRNDKDEVVFLKGDSEIISDSQNKKIWAKNFLPVQKAIKKAGSLNLYVVDESGFSYRRSLMDGTPVSEKIALLSVFGKDYGSGNAGKDNVDVLMQDAAPFSVQLMTDDDGNAKGINIEASNRGHIMFNPELHSGKKEFPKFAKNYEPYFVVRYTGEMNIGWNGGKDFFVGARFLINPSSQTKSGTDI